MLTISPFYPNRILDYCMVETLKPYIRRGMYQYCVGNVDKRGIRAGKKAVLRHCRRYKYYIKLDIRKFYPSVSSQRMIAFAESGIKDKQFIHLCRVMLSGSDDLPIGSYYSQWFSNWFLQDLDHYVKEALKVPFYVRYVDDMVLMGNNKRKLLNAMYCVNRFLKTKGLELKRFEQVKQIASAPVDFLGFRFGADGAKLRTRNFKLLNRRLHRVRKFGHICVSQARCLLAYIAWLRETQNGYSFYLRHMRGAASKGKLRRVVSQYERGHVLQCV